MTIKKTLSINEELYNKLEKYSNKYFQGNVSATVVFIICKYFEENEDKNKANISNNLIQNLDFLNN